MGNQFEGLGIQVIGSFILMVSTCFFEAGCLKVKNIQKSHFRDKSGSEYSRTAKQGEK